MSGLAMGRTNPERDAAREAKRARYKRRGTVPAGTTFKIHHTGDEWWAFAFDAGGDLVAEAFGSTPVSAIIAAEIAVFGARRQ